MMKVGDKVKHRSRPDVGVGEIIEFFGNATCTVLFSSSKFSGIPLDAIGTIEELERERCEKEALLKQQQDLIEKKRIAEIKAQKDKKRRQRILAEQKKQKEKEERQLAKKRAREVIVEKFSHHGIHCLWHITHKDNISNILNYGILNHYDAYRFHANRVDISDPDAQRWREGIEPHYQRKIHDYAPLYIKQRNPMLYVRRHLQDELCLVEVSLSVMFENEYLITDGNAASRDTKFFNSVNHIDALPWDVLHGRFWPDYDDGKRKMCAEVLVYPKVTPNHIGAVHCYERHTLNALASCGRKVELSRNLFF